jgi:hypothetical protein
VSTATVDRPAPVPVQSRRCEVLLRPGSTQPGTRTRRTECGEKAASLCLSVCSCGHESRRWACRQCASVPGTCRLCWDEGHECQVTITQAGDRS